MKPDFSERAKALVHDVHTAGYTDGLKRGVHIAEYAVALIRGDGMTNEQIARFYLE